MLLRIGLAVAVVAVAAVVVGSAVAQPRETEKQETAAVAMQRPDFRVDVTDEMRRHSRIREVLYFVGFAYTLLVLVLVLATGLSKRMREVAARVVKQPFVIAMLYVALFTIVTTVLEFPLAYYSGFVVPHQFDLTTQSLGSWMGDLGKGLAMNILVTAPIAALAYLAIRKLRRWWLAIWIGAVPIGILLVALQPLVFDPMFNRFEPLQDQVLRTKLLDLASRAGIESGRVYQVNKSKQTSTMNAYVNGIGPTNRIVMWDTLLAKMTHDEVVSVMAHEMGHYVMRHIWKGMAFGLALAFPLLFLGQKVYERGIGRWGSRWGIEGPGDPAALPWLLIVVSVGSFFLSPVTSGYSRRIEHQADIFALEVTHQNEAFAHAFIKLAEDSKRDPDPPRFMEIWRYSHPAISRRIAFALDYRPWERGEPNRLWKE